MRVCQCYGYGFTRARYYARVSVWCLHHLHHINVMIHVFCVVASGDNLAASCEKKWPPNFAGRPPCFEKVVQVVQAPDSHARV